MRKFGRNSGTVGGEFRRHKRAVGGSTAARFCRLAFEPLEPRRLLDAGPLLINEFMAVNHTVLQDEDNEYSDWIEIHNPSPLPVDLDGWYLTDDPKDLTRWQFPAYTLDPGGYLVVFASGNDRPNPSELHTNFKLDGDGESVALVMPGGQTVAHAYWDFPPQRRDVSYGVTRDVTTFFVPEDAAVTYLVPTSAEAGLGTAWTLPGFDDSSWSRFSQASRVLITEIGTESPDFVEIQNVSRNPIDTSGWVVAVNDAVLPSVNDMETMLWELPESIASGEVLYRCDDPEDTEHFWGDDIFWRTKGPGWAMVVDDGGNVVDFVVWGYSPAEIDSLSVEIGGHQVTVRDVWRGEAVPLNTDKDFMLGRSGGSDHDAASDWAFTSAVSPGQPNPELALPFATDVATGIGFDAGSAGLEAVIQIDVREAMHTANASLWARIPFEVDDPAGLDVMQLQMNYNDGFVAYVNGQEVARRNAPDSLQWNSAATEARTVQQSLTAEEIDLTDCLDKLVTGTNVLAIRGLNVDKSDWNFLILPDLVRNSRRYFAKATPGEPNTPGFIDYAADTKFSVDRGFYSEPFQVEITTATPEATIKYTRDGSPPTEQNGFVYSGAITIDATTTLRAAAFKEGCEPSNVDTQTYIFIDDVIRQPANPPGFPSTWGVGIPADYEMDPDVIGTFDENGNPNGDDKFGGIYAAVIRDALQTHPTISLVMDPVDLWSGATGIYANTLKEGLAWEREVSVEMIDFAAGDDAQFNAGIRIQGNASRQPSRPKHNMRLIFRSEYGPGKLEYPLFGDTEVQRYNEIILRGGNGDSWFHPNSTRRPQAQYAHDQWHRDVQAAMGQPAPYQTDAHLYINGLYWGFYHIIERPEWSYMEEHFGGDKEDYDVIQHKNGTVNGNRAAWNEMMNLIRTSDLSTPGAYAAVLQHIDPVNLADFMLINYYSANTDWDHNNWYGGRKRELGETWKFFTWDAEVTFRNLTADITGVLKTNQPTEVHQALRANPEYRMLFADRVHKHLFNGGALTPEAVEDYWLTRGSDIELPLIAESARWADHHRPDDPYTVEDEFRNRQNWFLTTWFPQRTGILLNQLKARGLYPSVVAPSFNQHGGQVPEDFLLTMSAPGGTVYYTLDGSDPRLPGGGVSPTAFEYNGPGTVTLVDQGADWKYLDDGSDQGTAWHAPVFNDSGWSSGPAQLGYGDADEATTVSYGPDAGNKYVTTYFRQTFHLASTSNIAGLTLKLLRDDGAVVYLNGQEIARSNLPAGAVDYQTLASSGVSGGEESTFHVFSAIDPGLLRAGSNVIAVEIHQRSVTSSDISFDLELEATVNTGAVSLGESTLVRSRGLDAGKWSALNEALFYVGEPAGAENLALTEINYNPYDPTDEELAAQPPGEDPFAAQDFEFVELRNVSDETIDLTGVRFVDGIDFEFTSNSAAALDAGEFVVVAANRDAFQARYGSGVNLAGEYAPQDDSKRLDNNGERIKLIDRFEQPIVDFEYNDAGGWPGRADGKGASLELIDPAAVPQTEPERTDYLQDDKNWRSGSEYGGSPGSEGEGPRGDVLVNEVLTNTPEGMLDAIELYNATAEEVDLGGWYLSDSWGWESNADNGNYKKYRIPDGTKIAAGGYLVFDENDFNSSRGTDPNDFALDGAHGDDVWLMEAGAGGKLTRFVDHADFMAAKERESLGRWPDGEGELYPMTDTTLGSENSGPRVGPLVVSELHYNPGQMEGAEDLEYVEIYNSTGETVDLTNWRLRKGVDFDFPPGTLLAPFSPLAVLPFDPHDPASAAQWSAFCDEYGLDENATDVFLGGYQNKLDNGGERVQLHHPDDPVWEPESQSYYLPHYLEDEVIYDDEDGWPPDADGTGESLHRLRPDAWGNAGENWTSQEPTPGDVPFLPATEIKARYVFYNNSAFDGYDPSANEQDQQAIAEDKAALQRRSAVLGSRSAVLGSRSAVLGRQASAGTSGETSAETADLQSATFANYTSYDRGINGIIVDIANPLATPTANDFLFHAGNSDDPANWSPAADPASVTVTPGAGREASCRVTIIWPDYAIRNTWLQVTVLAENLGLPGGDDVFYYGNAVGESGNSDTDAIVDETDVTLIRNNPRNFFNPAGVTFPYDYNRDARVNATDVLIARANQTDGETALKLIDLTGPEGAGHGERTLVARSSAEGSASPSAPADLTRVFEPAGGADRSGQEAWLGQLAWLYEFELFATRDRPSRQHEGVARAVDELLAAGWP